MLHGGNYGTRSIKILPQEAFKLDTKHGVNVTVGISQGCTQGWLVPLFLEQFINWEDSLVYVKCFSTFSAS